MQSLEDTAPRLTVTKDTKGRSSFAPLSVKYWAPVGPSEVSQFLAEMT